MWPCDEVEDNINCLVSIGTSLSALTPFRDHGLHIGTTLKKFAMEPEQAAERFRRDNRKLVHRGCYFRFNVSRGLERIRFEESRKIKEVAATTRHYLTLEEVLDQVRACGDILSGRRGKFLRQVKLSTRSYLTSEKSL